ncbi:hypothetical protein [Noviluteimonas gilva]|uniref:Uncharacterized protein n=1 Tax=Noviluteimonas gilva TaxID=2682097 RepID=A0A7C9HS75_9GAMM|nr:hypothetical protein [Lysobacter gilvus]MUV14011.1 hypothetical protein [Lysobacter gilvus]
MASIDGSDWLRIDERLRSHSQWSVNEAQSTAEEAIAFWRSTPDADIALFAVACGFDGYRRQAALRALRDFPSPITWATALIRCDDWVAQVREEATQLAHHLIEVRAPGLHGHLDLIVQLRKRERFTATTMSWLDRALREPRDADVRWNTPSPASPHVRRLAFELIEDSDPQNLEALWLRAARDPNAAIALRAVARATGETRERVLAAAARNPNAAVRAEVLRAKVREGAADARDAVTSALFDRANAPRTTAAWIARNTLHIEPRDLWRAAVDAGAEPAAGVALRALNSQGDAADLPRFVAALRSGDARHRTAGLAGIASVAPEALDDWLPAALMDPASRVARLAVRLARRMGWSPSTELLERLHSEATSEIARTRLLSVAHLPGKWAHLDLLLAWLVDTKPMDRKLIGLHLLDWLRNESRSMLPLDDATRARLLNRMARAQGHAHGGIRHDRMDWDRMRFVLEHA